MTGCAGSHRPCARCERALDFDFTMAFQPIVDIDAARPFAYEALVRGTDGASAGSVLSRLNEHNLHAFDQACRIRAIEWAHRLGMDCVLSINFLPDAVYTPRACIEATLDKATEVGWPTHQLSFEIVETENVRDRAHLQRIVAAYRDIGFHVALDDFGTGYANLDLLIDLTPHYVKLDRALVDGVAHDRRKALIAARVIEMARSLDLGLIAEGVEKREDARWLYARGVSIQQGFLYAKPAIERLPEPPPALIAEIRGS